MIRSSDGVVDITVASDTSEIVFQPADWSIMNIPIKEVLASKLSDNLFNMPTHRHISLVLNRHRRKDRMKGLSCLSSFDNKNWRFLDNVSLSYGRPSACSNNGFLPLCEHGYIFYKGDTPDTKNTEWASEAEHINATNNWELFLQKNEDAFQPNTYYQKFSWDLQTLLMSLCGQLEHSRFIYGVLQGKVAASEIKSIYTFCKNNSLSVELITASTDVAENILNQVEKLIEEVKND